MSLIAQHHHNCPTCRCAEPVDAPAATQVKTAAPDYTLGASELRPDAADVAGLVDWVHEHSARLGQVQGFGYGKDGLLLVVRDCCLKDNQAVWEKQSSAGSQRADHDEMVRQIDIYRMSLAFAALARMKEAKE